MSLYKRIAALSTEAVETLYALGAEDYIVGISGYTVRPARARQEKIKISAFSSAQLERILAVQPDLVIGFSDMQAEICRDLVKAGIETHVFNQRSIPGILRMIAVLAAMVEKPEAGQALIAQLQHSIQAVQQRASEWQRKPVVYFEEWNEPLMSGIGWIAEMVELAGGRDAFPELSVFPNAKNRIIADPQEVVQRAPDIIIASWCGKKFQPEQLKSRAGWAQIPALANGMLFEIKSPDILSPGPAAISEGLQQISDIIAQWQALSPPSNNK